jgi:dihydrofolate reductase
MMNNSSRRIERGSLEVDHAARPGWVTANDRLPQAGEEVFCTGGVAVVIRVLGRTGDRSRLLELKLAEGDGKPFFAAASNVLIAADQAQLA